MFHKAIGLKLLEGTALEVSYEDGAVKRYDMRKLFPKYPQLKALEDRALFLSAKMIGAYGIIWNDELDIDTETIYEDGETIRKENVMIHHASSRAVSAARASAGVSQKRLAELTGIDQSDISKIERGVSNPSVATLERIAEALHGQLSITIDVPTA
ncbi:MAG: helix-turn-helix domain-containing protein [Oscillospiraceae bacterium]|nr:helix-turn-helix domain-containing protein [Oscillospiraceae bacterium]